MLPAESDTRPCGPEFGVVNAYCLFSPVAGSSRPIAFACCAVYHSAPSAPTAGSCGRDFAVGSSHSRIETLTFAAANAIVAYKEMRTSALRIPNLLLEVDQCTVDTCGARRRPRLTRPAAIPRARTAHFTTGVQIGPMPRRASSEYAPGPINASAVAAVP